jgi:hypothetical protein
MRKPVLQAMVLADHIYRDHATGKFIIAGTFSRVVFVQKRIEKEEAKQGEESGRTRIVGPVGQVGSPFLYLALVDIEGKIPLELKFVNLADATVLFEASIEIDFPDPLKVAEFSIALPPLQVVQAGNYSLDLLFDDELLGAWRISGEALENEQKLD